MSTSATLICKNPKPLLLTVASSPGEYTFTCQADTKANALSSYKSGCKSTPVPTACPVEIKETSVNNTTVSLKDASGNPAEKYYSCPRTC